MKSATTTTTTELIEKLVLCHNMELLRMFVATSETNSVQALNLDGDNEGTLTK